MSGGRGAGGRRRRKQVSVEERAAAAEDYRKAVDLLQYTAYRNLRHAIAYATVFVAVAVAVALTVVGVTGMFLTDQGRL
ncbi:hypothetical protein ACFWFK_24405 [Micromonospora chalcea]